MSQLPKGWVSSKLQDSIFLNEKLVGVPDDTECGFVPMALVPTKYGEGIQFESRIWAECKKGYTQFQNNDVLLAKITPCFENGKGALVSGLPNGIGAGSTEYFVLRSVGGLVEPKYLHAFVKTKEFLINCETNMSGSVGHRRVPKDYLLSYTVPLAPLPEQKRIVEKLDEVLAQVDTIKARLDGIPNLLKRFRQSVLASAVSGKLTEEWRTGRSLKQWVTLNLNEVTSHVVDCPHSTPKWSDEGRYCVRTTAFNPFYLDLSGQDYVNDEVFEQRTSRLTPEAGDILYSREGTVGIACQIPEGVELCLGQRMVVIRANEKVNAKYLTIVLNSDHILRIVRELTIGSTAPRVNMKVIRDYPIPVPDCIEQKEIVRLVDQYFAFANTIEAQVKKAQARVDSLTQSILAKAFRGELVPQNDDDESAEVLLERIAKARKEAEALAKTAKKAGKKKA